MAGFFKKLFTKFSRGSRIDWDELEADLVTADIGIRRAMNIADQLRESKGLDAENLVEATREVLRQAFPATAPSLPAPPEGKPLVILVVGVNGTGKPPPPPNWATCCKNRAPAFSWPRRTPSVPPPWNSSRAGRTSWKFPSTRERPTRTRPPFAMRLTLRPSGKASNTLSAIPRGACTRAITLWRNSPKSAEPSPSRMQRPPHRTLLVVDATTGANALAQAREFHKATPLDSVIITKMDGSGKGGVAVAIMDEMHISHRGRS